MHKSWDLKTPVGDLVAQAPQLAPLLEAVGIDYCCGGKLSLQKAAEQANLHALTLLATLKAALQNSQNLARHGAADENPANFDSPKLIKHIITKHHGYLRQELPRLEQLARKVAQAHHAHNPGLTTLVETLSKLSKELLAHLNKEETEVFPSLLKDNGDSFEDRAATSLSELEREHEDAGAALDRLKSLSHSYDLPSWACESYRQLMTGLREFETDMHQHVHLENNVLFPRYLA